MDPKKVLQADYLDIIFDNRNKAYGGYELRKNYDRRVKKGVGFLMLSVTALASFSFIDIKKKTEIILPRTTVTTLVDVSRNQPPPPKPATPPPSAPPAKTALITPPRVVDDNMVKPEETMTEASKLHDAIPGSHNSDSGDIASITPSGEGPSGPPVPVTPPAPKIFVFASQMPEFKGDMQGFLSNNLVYPAAAKEAGVSGRVAVEFVVNEDGSITDARVTHGIGAGCDEEALRVIRSMPKWKPGKQNGTPVKVLFTQVINFRIDP